LGVVEPDEVAKRVRLENLGQADVAGEPPLLRDVGHHLEFVAARLAVAQIGEHHGHAGETADVAPGHRGVAERVGGGELLRSPTPVEPAEAFSSSFT
jgi:hypothetical protein